MLKFHHVQFHFLGARCSHSSPRLQARMHLRVRAGACAQQQRGLCSKGSEGGVAGLAPRAMRTRSLPRRRRAPRLLPGATDKTLYTSICGRIEYIFVFDAAHPASSLRFYAFVLVLLFCICRHLREAATLNPTQTTFGPRSLARCYSRSYCTTYLDYITCYINY